jgi:hypothetical protein
MYLSTPYIPCETESAIAEPSPERKGNAKFTTTDNKNMLTTNFCGIPKKNVTKVQD